MPVQLNVMQLNPMHAGDPDRLAEIIHNTSKFDLVVLTGTGHKSPPQAPAQGLTQRSIDKVTVLEAGYKTGCYTNASTGITFLIRGKHLKSSNLVAAGSLQGPAQGRAAYVRFKTRGSDLLFIGAYFPPKPCLNRELPKYRKTCQVVIDYIQKVVQGVPSSAVQLYSLI